MSRIILASKLNGETRKDIFDFTSMLAVGETISTAQCSAAVYSGVDASPAVLSGNPSISGAQVTQALTAGVVGVTYKLTCTITTSASQTLMLAAFLTIIPNVT